MIHLEIKAEIRNRILRELKVLHKCSSPNIIGFYGSFWHEGDINILMEYMVWSGWEVSIVITLYSNTLSPPPTQDGGSLDAVLRRVGRIEEPVLAHVTSKVGEGWGEGSVD